MEIRVRPNRDPVAIRQRRKGRRQLFFRGHLYIIHKNRYHRNGSLQRRLDLKPEMILAVIQSSNPRIGSFIPLPSDHGNQHRAMPHLLPNVLPEVDSQRYVIDVLENSALSEMLR